MTRRQEWFQAMFAGLYGQVLPKTFTPERTMQQVRLVKRLLRLRPGRQVLDVPCGQGRLTLPLAKMGMVMTGADLTGSYLRMARQAATRKRLKVGFVQCDMRRLDFDGRFDAAFNWFGSFGYFREADNLRYCRRVFRALKPGGRFLVEGLNKTWVVRNFQPDAQSDIGGVHIEHHHWWDERNSRVRDRWILSKGRRVERHHISLRLYNVSELGRLLKTAGFRDIEFYGMCRLGRLSRLGPDCRRIIAVAMRPRQ